jgi:hypothetical protein
MTIEIVEFPINSMVIFHSYVSLPEGTYPLVNVNVAMEKINIFHIGKSTISMDINMGYVL